MIIVGELINMTRKAPREAWESRNAEAIASMARKQAEAGADYIDVNSGVAGEEAACMRWLVETVQEAVELPLCIDTAHAGALETALTLVKQPPLVNSVSAEKERWTSFLPLLKGTECRVVALLVGDGGLPKTADDRMANAAFLLGKLDADGHTEENVFVDPCVTPVSTDTAAVGQLLASLTELRTRWPASHRIAGLSNVSFGLPARALLNRTFLALAMGAGLDAAILDPTNPQIRQVLYAADTLLGADDYCQRFIKAFRGGLLG